MHAPARLCEREKTKVRVDLSICFRVAIESYRFEELIALQNLCLGTVKIRTVYWEQGSFLSFFIHTYTCPLQGVPLQSLRLTTLCETTTDLFAVSISFSLISAAPKQWLVSVQFLSFNFLCLQ